jgi:dTDP-glucose 4,6-dehydratase
VPTPPQSDGSVDLTYIEQVAREISEVLTDYRVIAIDNTITGSPDNIAHIASNPYFEFICHDVSEFIFVPGPVDFVFHFASPASPVDYLELPIPALKVGA